MAQIRNGHGDPAQDRCPLCNREGAPGIFNVGGTRMPRTVHLVAASFAMFLTCSVAGAQMRGGTSFARATSVRAAPTARISPRIPRAIPQVRLSRLSPTGQLISGFAPFSHSTSLVSANGVPGLGFDYAHLAAITSNLHTGRPLNFARGGRRGQVAIVPIVIGGYPYYDFGYAYGDNLDYDQSQYQSQFQPSIQEQPQVIVIQQPGPVTQQAADSGTESPAPAAPRAAEPVHDVGEFVLVQRDGRILFASAFSIAGAQLTYITPEGFRHTLAMTQLDTDATQQMNEARGTTVQIHN